MIRSKVSNKAYRDGWDKIFGVDPDEHERPQPVNLGKHPCAHCRRMVTEAGKYDHNLAKHPELYRNSLRTAQLFKRMK